MPKKHFILAFTGLVALALSVGPLLVKADPESEFAAKEKQLSQKASEVRNLGDEIQVLDESIDVKTKFIAELSVKVAKAKAELEAINQDLAGLQQQRLTYQKMLNSYVREDYIDQPPNEYELLASDKSLMENLITHTYLGSFQAFADQIVKKLAKVEDQVKAKQDQSLTKFQSLDRLEAQAESETSELAAIRSVKQQLLDQTQGQEALFRQQYEQARAALEATGAFARSARDRIGSRVWDDSGFYFNQLDSRWIDDKLGFSNSSTFGDYGCGLASLAMVFKYYGIGTNPPGLNEDLKRVRAFVDDLLNWRNVAAASGGRLALANSPYPLGRVDWGFIDQQLASGNPVIVYINRGSMSHYVVLLEKRNGAYIMHDPIEGPYLRFADYYRQDSIYQFITFRRA